MTHTLRSMFEPVMPVQWVLAHRDEVVLVDVRWYLDGRSGYEAFLKGHIPGAGFVSMDATLAGPPTPEDGRHPLPDPVDFARGMSDAGIGDGSTVIAYDDSGGMAAARLVWLLRVLGERAALLDGGLATWSEGREVGPTSPDPARFTIRRWPEARLAAIDTIEAAVDAGTPLIDARAPERYRGDREPVDPRPGHIPGAVSVPFKGNLGADDMFLPSALLRDRFEAAGVTQGGEAIVYCGSGVTACHDLLALERSGLAIGRLFPGSWSQWSADETRPAMVGPDPALRPPEPEPVEVAPVALPDDDGFGPVIE
jgi:thiosulfate/3-mercaptopyruvate sulfurtransferase